MLHGVAAYDRLHGPWIFFQGERNLGTPMPERLKDWRPDGIIARLTGEKMIANVRRLQVPTVDLYHEDETADIPGVATNQESLVRLAIEHFLDRGFRNFAYCGFPRVLFSDLRAECFIRQLAQRGCRANVFAAPAAARRASLATIESHTAAPVRCIGPLAA